MKNSQKGFAIPIIIAIVALLAVGGGAYIYTNNKVEAPVSLPEVISDMPTTTTSNIVGGDRDIHGCIGSAGYSWCEVKNKCLRTWEEKCEVVSTTTKPSLPVACTMDAKKCPDGSYVGRSGPNCEFVCPIPRQVVIKTKSQLFLETMNKDLGINKSVVSTSIYSYSGYGFGSGWVVQSIHSKYIQDKLPTVSGTYTSESGTGYTNGQIVCVIQGIREFIPNSPPVTTHEELVCMDIK